MGAAVAFQDHVPVGAVPHVASHPGRLLRRELDARHVSANRLALDLGVPSGRITDILNGRRSITAETAVRLGLYFGTGAQFWLDLQSQYDIAVIQRDRGAEIAQRVRCSSAGLDSRCRDSDGEIRHKRSDTLIGTLRQTYGEDFASGYRSNAKLGAVLKRENARTLSELLKRR
jgi:addiction module HigA family antidote